MVTVAASKGADSSKLTKPGSLVKEAAGERPEKQKARTGQRCVREATKNDLFLGDALLSLSSCHRPACRGGLAKRPEKR
jgi:hypothetical protein